MVIKGTLRTLKRQRNKYFYGEILLLPIPLIFYEIRTLDLWFMSRAPYPFGHGNGRVAQEIIDSIKRLHVQRHWARPTFDS